MKYLIRKATEEDCKFIARITTISWNETYKGIVPEWFLKELKENEEKRIKTMTNNFNENKKYLLLEVDNEVVGFVKYNKSNDKDYDNCGEIIALYIIKKYHGNGYGKKLVDEAVRELKNMKCDKMLISCLKENPTNEFYKHIGGKYIKDSEFKKLNLLENVYYFDI